MTVLNVNLLGPFAVSLDSTPVNGFSTIKVRALLAYLAVEGYRSLDRSHVAGFLWPDVMEESARGNLRFALSNLRKVINDKDVEPPFLLAGRRSVQLNPDALDANTISVDVAVFQSLYKLATTGKQKSNLQPALDAIQLYQGPFLSNLGDFDSPEFEDWVQIQREVLHRQMAELLTLASLTSFSNEHFDDAVRYAQKLVDHEPWSEEAHVHLMNALWHNGQGDVAMRQFEQCRRALEEELEVDPAPETVALYEAIRDNRTDFRQAIAIQAPSSQAINWASSTVEESVDFGPRHNIPSQLKPFFGRESEIAQIDGMIDQPECRQLTVVGPGGMGKTHLAIEYGRSQVEDGDNSRWADGVWFVSLVNTPEASQIPAAIADALKVELAADESPLESICRILRRRSLLLILDNFEHLSDGAIQVNQMLEEAPAITIICTSRTRLNLKTESVFNLSGLTFALDAGNAPHSVDDASAFFIDCAKRKDPDFTLEEAQQRRVNEICTLVGGMPLAIELAAAWTRVLSLDEIIESLNDNLSFLATSMPDLPERHRSILTLIEQSWQRMSEAAQQIFAQLSVFRRGWDWRAMQAVTGASLESLAELIDNSLVSKDSEGRYQVHGLLRQFGQEQLEAQPVLSAETADKHTDYYMAFLQKHAPNFYGPKQAEAVRTVEGDIENVLTAWRCAVLAQDWGAVSKGATGLFRYLDTLDKAHDGAELFGPVAIALESVGDEHRVLQVQVLNSQSYFLSILCRFDEAMALVEGSLAISASASTDLATLLRPAGGRAHALLGSLLRLSDPGKARREYHAAIELMQTPSDIPDRIRCLHELSETERQDQNFDLALEYVEKALRLARQIYSPLHVSMSLAHVANVYQDMGQFDEVRQRNQEALRLAKDIGNRKLAAEILNNMAITEHYTGELDKSYSMFEESRAIHRSLGGGTRAELMASGNMARTALRQGRFEVAEPLFRETAHEWQAVGDVLRQARNLQGLVETLLGARQLSQARGEYNALLEDHHLEAHHEVLTREVLGMVLSTGAELLAAEGKEQSAAVVDAFLCANFPSSAPPVKEAMQRRQQSAEQGDAQLIEAADNQAASMTQKDVVGILLIHK